MRIHLLLMLATLACRSVGPGTPREPASYLALVDRLAASAGALSCDTAQSPDRAGRRVPTLSCGSQWAGGAFHYVARRGSLDHVYRLWLVPEPAAAEQAWQTAASLLRRLGAEVLECGGRLQPDSPMERINTWSLSGRGVVLAMFRPNAVVGPRQVVLQASDVPPGPLCRHPGAAT